MSPVIDAPPRYGKLELNDIASSGNSKRPCARQTVPCGSPGPSCSCSPSCPGEADGCSALYTYRWTAWSLPQTPSLTRRRVRCPLGLAAVPRLWTMSPSSLRSIHSPRRTRMISPHMLSYHPYSPRSRTLSPRLSLRDPLSRLRIPVSHPTRLPRSCAGLHSTSPTPTNPTNLVPINQLHSILSLLTLRLP